MTPGPHQTRPHGRSLSDFLDSEGKLLPAEQQLLGAAASGVGCTIARERPKAATPENTIRAPFLRFLALGGDDNNPLHEHGIQLGIA